MTILEPEWRLFFLCFRVLCDLLSLLFLLVFAIDRFAIVYYILCTDKTNIRTTVSLDSLDSLDRFPVNPVVCEWVTLSSVFYRPYIPVESHVKPRQVWHLDNRNAGT